MFSQTSEYALRVVAYLATLEGKPATTRQLAVATKIPQGYLAKVVRSLNRAGLLLSQRGLHGGSILARPAEDITVYDVVNAVNPIPRIRTCPLGIRLHGTSLCPLHRKLDDTIALVERAFRAATIAALLNEPSGSKPLCDTESGQRDADGRTHSGKISLTVSRRRKGE